MNSGSDRLSRLRELPSVDEVLSRPAVQALEPRLGRAALRDAARVAIAAARARLLAEASAAASSAAASAAASSAAASAVASSAAPTSSHDALQAELVPDSTVIAEAQRAAAPRLRRVINATGVVLHTNLGRAPLHPEAIAQLVEVAGGYSNLEIDLATGKRGHRSAAVEPLLCELFGAESAHAVNNCAGATLLALAALGAGGAAVVSRGELVEIGGGFRVPEILAQSGCRLIEVGTTNRTRLADYEAALDALEREGTRALILRVHRSNFALVGFTSEPTLAELGRLARERRVPLLHDLGSGALLNPVAPGLPLEPGARQSLADGAGLVLCSGDKLLGGPQAGLMLGERALVERCKRHPLARALRLDKLLLAALEATLRLYRAGRGAELPALAAMGADRTALGQRATLLALRLHQRGIETSIVDCEGQVGGGSLPSARLASRGVAVPGPAPQLAALLRQGGPAGELPALALVRDDLLVLDVRCVPEAELSQLADAVAAAVHLLGERASGGEVARAAGTDLPKRTDAGEPVGATLLEDGTEV